ncbi:glycosyltransferase family 4 protein [uncultured Bacteroides sp.]|uniref:glycosyltransferase family 4 protein n=1 Tax=uncultured Bacteroides sp. TaxID=162156 RepID=UPI0025E7608A|nr:glycosyltransferase family 4 protein [uncultured Bacteroides sp.]
MPKKILIHSLVFRPDGVSTAYLYNDIALEFQKSGYEVVVLTTTPHYNVIQEQIAQIPMTWKLWGLCKESNFQGIKVLHIPQKKFKSTILRVLGFLYWHIVSFFIGLFQKNVDVILSPSPPLTIGVINLWLAKLKGCKVVYNVQEIYPDILGKKQGIIVSILSKMERYVYNNSDAVTTIDQVFYDTIVGRFKDRSKLHIIPNFVDTELYNRNKAERINLDDRLFPKTDSLKLLYAGNVGFAQDWETLIELAKATQNYPVEYFVIGEGVMKPYLIKQVEEMKLFNVHILPYQSRESIPGILAYSDIQFIFMNPEMEMQGFPSKVYTIMACGKPLLVCSGNGTPIVNFLKDYDCAKLVQDRDSRKKVEEIARWLQCVSKEKLALMGENGLNIITKYYAKDIVTQQYVKRIELLLN